MTDTTTPPAVPTTDTIAVDADKTVGEILTVAETATEAEIIASQPWMGTPVLKQLWQAFLNWVFGILGGLLGTDASYVVIDIQKYIALKNAASALAKLQAAQSSGDPNAISQASAGVDAAVAPVLHYIGDAHS